MLLAVKAMGGESSDAGRSVLDDLIGRGALPPRLSGSLTPNSTTPVNSRCKIPPAAGGDRPYRCTVPLHDKDVFDTHVLACAAPAPPKRAVTGVDRGTMAPRKPATIRPKFVVHLGNPGFHRPFVTVGSD